MSNFKKNRREFLLNFSRVTGAIQLAGLARFGLLANPALADPSSKARVVIVGGGWGGLAAARELRRLAPSLEVILIEQNPRFWSHPLSNRWLVNLAETSELVFDYASVARRYGYQFVQDEVLEIDREQRKVITQSTSFGYDWLVLAAGIRENFSAWFGDDQEAARHSRAHFSAAFMSTGGRESLSLKSKLQQFSGGDLLMTIPPLPYRCPPAPYERAGMIAWWMKEHKIKGRLVLLDPNQPPVAFTRIFRDSYSDQITYLPQSQIKSIDPFQKQVITDFETIDFTDAILMPPQEAAEIVWQSGLIGTDKNGKVSGWAGQDPVHFHSLVDDRVYLVGDAVDRASTLFGFYPKTGEMALRQGVIAAREIVVRENGSNSGSKNSASHENLLPASSCYIVQRISPMEISKLDTSYRFRSDGVIQQMVKQTHYPQAQDEDKTWAKAMWEALGLVG